ncbi:MAG: hypothetical protein K0R57_5022 [Paenibacillaceae bacterium]|jgi:hypothetical protein|nr:hypothetical protein [Paenibacillaceae bacterium]
MILCQKHLGKTVKTEVKDKSFQENYDVIVVGLGTAGAIASICAAEYGLSVLALETGDCMGGTGTSGAVLGYYYGASGGRFEEVDQVVYNTDHEIFAASNHIYPDHILPAKKAMVLEQQALGAGVEIRYDAWTSGVFVEQNQVVGLQWKDDGGVHNTGARYVIDCTGEADICAMAGCETARGRPFEGKTQPYSLCTMTLKDGNVTSYYADNGFINCNDGQQYSDQILHTYTQSMFLKGRFDPENYYSIIAPQAGIREGRRIVGEEEITFVDFLTDNLTDRPLFYTHCNIDTHGIEHAFEDKRYIEWCIVSKLKLMNFSVPVPAGALIPRGYKGILAAGRCLAADRQISPGVRVKRDMQKCGEAASALAYWSIRDGVEAKAADYEKVAAMLRKTKCLDDANNRLTYRIDEKGSGEKINRRVQWLTDKEQIFNEMKGAIPGVAIWSAKRLGGAVIHDLKQWLACADEAVRFNSAFALGLLGDPGAIPVLREIISVQPDFEQETPVNGINNVLGAIYLLGELGDAQSVPYLIEMIKKDKHNNEYLQHFFFSMMALIRIGNSSSDEDVKQAVTGAMQWIMDNKNEIYMTLNAKENIVSDLTTQTKEFIQANYRM